MSFTDQTRCFIVSDTVFLIMNYSSATVMAIGQNTQVGPGYSVSYYVNTSEILYINSTLTVSVILVTMQLLCSVLLAVPRSAVCNIKMCYFILLWPFVNYVAFTTAGDVEP